MINIIGTIAITVLCLDNSSELDSESESDSNDEITMVLINIVTQIFCIILIIDFCIGDCCKSCDKGNGNCDMGKMECSGGGGGGGNAGLGLLLICVFIIAIAMIYAFFYFLTEGIGKHASRLCSLVTICFFETLIAVYCIYLYFMDDNGETYVYIFGVSLGLSMVNFIGFLIPFCNDCSVFCLNCWKSCCCCCCHPPRKSIINKPIVRQNNINDQKKGLLSNNFDINPMPISPPSNNSSIEDNFNGNFIIYNDYFRNNNNINLNDNNCNENTPIDNITKPKNDFDNDIERTGSNYDNAPLPYDYDYPSEKEILENYQKNANNNDTNY